ncbi:MAG: hypothetical protein ACSHX7_14335 [Luteolibacter sp.]
METVATFSKGEDAYLFRSFLESEGIAAHVFDEYVAQNYWLYTNAVGGIRVAVDVEDAAEAERLYRSYEETVFAEPQVVGEVKAWPAVLLATFIVGVPFLFIGRKKPEAGNL